MITSARRNRAIFALISMTIATMAVIVFRSAVYARHAEVLAWSFTFDLTLTIPLLYWFLVVRGGHARAVTMAPVFVICLAVAARIVPAGQQQFLYQLRWLAAPLDVITLWLVARRLARGTGTGNSVVDRIMVSELTVLRYGLLSWRHRPPAGFTVHKRAGWGSVLACILVLIVAESLGLHLLVQQWSVRVAWVLTALDLYSILWLLGDYQALRLRPTTIADGVLHLRYGFRWSADVPLANIASLLPVHGEWKRKGVLKVAMLDEPTLMIALREPVKAVGFAGLLTREIDAVAVRVDQAEEFERRIQAGLENVECPVQNT